MKKHENIIIGRDSNENESFIRVFKKDNKIGISIDYLILMFEDNQIDEFIKELRYLRTH